MTWAPNSYPNSERFWISLDFFTELCCLNEAVEAHVSKPAAGQEEHSIKGNTSNWAREISGCASIVGQTLFLRRNSEKSKVMKELTVSQGSSLLRDITPALES